MPTYKSDKPTKDKRVWYFTHSYTDKGNYKKYVSKKFKTKDEAQQEEAIFRMKKNIYIDKNTRTLKELAYEYLEYKKDKLKLTTLYSNKSVISMYIIPSKVSDKKIDRITMQDLQEFRNSLDPNKSSSYKNKIIVLLKAINHYSSNIYDTDNKYFSKLEYFRDKDIITKEMDYYTLEEFNQFIEHIDLLNYKALFTTLFFCGLRQGEALALTWNDIVDGNYKITKTLTTKIKGKNFIILPPKNKQSNRTIPIPNKVKEALDKWYNYISKVDGFNNNWFVFGDYENLKPTTIARIKDNACKLAGIKQIRIHDFRHSTASLLINNGANIGLVSKYLGHSNIETTLNIYSHLYESELEKIKERLDTL